MSAMTQFAERHGITATYQEVGSNPNMTDEKWAREATHYAVTLKHGKKTFTLYYSKGSALDYGVEPGEVLNALALDSSGVDNAGGDFVGWAADYGYEYDENCRFYTRRRAESLGVDCEPYFKAKETFDVTKRQAARLKSFLGEALYRELLETESD